MRLLTCLIPLLAIPTSYAPAALHEQHHGFWDRTEPRQEAIYRVTDTSRMSGTIDLDDGSKWRVSGSASWFDYPYSGDRVTFRNLDRRHGTNLEIVRLSDQRGIPCSPVQGPLLNGFRTLYVASLNCEQGSIILSDGTAWNIYENAEGWTLLWKWEVGDIVMPGTLQGQWGPAAQMMLFNCGKARWVAVDRS